MKSEHITTVGIVVVIAGFWLGGKIFVDSVKAKEAAAKQFLLQLRSDVDRHEKKLKELEAKLPKLALPKNMKTTYYGKEFHGKKMANGKLFDMRKKTVAHRTLPLGSMILMEYRGRHDIGEVTDRGPAEYTGNELDVSDRLAGTLGMRRVGRAKVQVTRLN